MSPRNGGRLGARLRETGESGALRTGEVQGFELVVEGERLGDDAGVHALDERQGARRERHSLDPAAIGARAETIAGRGDGHGDGVPRPSLANERVPFLLANWGANQALAEVTAERSRRMRGR